ncbi:kinase-like domain-containing protein, partial [Pelagophyceae sp. CCMP2097]
AIKHMSKQRVVFKQQLAHVHDERRLLAQVTHPNIVRLFGAFQDQASVYLVTELVEGPDVWSLVYDPRGAGFSSQGKLCDASDDLLRFYAACISLALAHLHDLGVVFRDLKPENLMVSKRGYLKLVDFGFAKLLPYYTSNAFAAKDDATRGTPRPSNAGVGLAAHFKTYTMCGTSELAPAYIPPEIINGSGHDWSADTWAAACVFHELFSGFTPFVEPGHGPRAATIFKRVLALQFKPLIPPFRVARRKHASTLILAMLKFDPSERINMAAVLAHAFFDGFDLDAVRNETFEPDWL